MVLLASDALLLTNDRVNSNDATDLQTEVNLAEAKIRAASGLGIYTITYSASVIGNPAVDPRTTTNVPANQLSFFNLFSAAGYLVGLDSATGHWFLSWSSSGAENLVAVYSFRTTFNPTSVASQTITAIQAYFSALRPIVHSSVRFNGFIDEAGFGGSTSTFYEFTVIVDQGADLTNHSADLKVFMTGQGLGFTTNNCNVYQLVN